MDFVTSLLLSANWKANNYNSILVIVNQLTKMVYYKLVKVTINAPGLAEVIINVVVQHYRLLDSIISDRKAIFKSKFWSSLCYSLGIKKLLSTVFYLQTASQTERQNRMMETYLCVFINWEKDNKARLLLMAEFTYNNSKNASTDHTLFELNCDYYLRMLYKEKVDLHSQSMSANKLLAELRELMIVCQKNFYHA